jgi:serine/threonine protein kinase
MSLARWVWAGRPRLEDYLEVAIQLAAMLERVQAARWIHCDVTPSNAIVDGVTLQTYLIDFGIAQPFGAQSHSMEVAHLAGTLPYISNSTSTDLLDPSRSRYPLRTGAETCTLCSPAHRVQCPFDEGTPERARTPGFRATRIPAGGR